MLDLLLGEIGTDFEPSMARAADVVDFMNSGFGWLLLWLIPLCSLMYLTYFLLGLPLRRRERARIFLDLLEMGLNADQSPEQTLLTASQSRVAEFSVRFHLLAAYLATGLRLEQALDKVPRLLPPQISAMLTAGVQIGDIAKVLPACRRLLSDSVSQTRGALNYLVIWAFLIAPICPFLIHTVNVWVFPKMLVVTEDILESAPPVLARSSDLNSMFVVVLIAILLFFQLLALCYVGGPRVKRWARFVCFGYPMADKLELLLPWRRKRLQRDFSAMLAILLDAGVPEKQSLLLAAESTANELFQRRAAAVSERLQQGTKLTEAVEQLDDAGEFRWRLANAAQAHRGFMAALSGWLESLDAKAFQQEQAAAQGLSTVIVLVNGAVVGVFAYGVFQMLTLIVQGAGLW